MEKNVLQKLLEDVANGTVTVEDALSKIKIQPYEDLGFAKVDHHRGVRQGANEVIYGAGKSKKQILDIAQRIINNGEDSVLATRVSKDTYLYLNDFMQVYYDEMSKICIIGEKPDFSKGVGKIVIATGGTSDIPVAEEAALTAQFYGSKVVKLYDVGVSGVHRLLDNVDVLADAKVVIAVAGMEGALASVVGGLVDCPVVAVPTSVGYGASFGGLSALLTMLNSCASGVSVVNIDNGFGAGYLANMINKI